MGPWLESLVPWGADFIVSVQSLSSPWLDTFFEILTFLGNSEFYLILLPLVYWCIHRRTGASLAYLSLSSAWINSLVKYLFKIPRPGTFDSRIRVLVEARDLHPQLAGRFLPMEWEEPVDLLQEELRLDEARALEALAIGQVPREGTLGKEALEVGSDLVLERLEPWILLPQRAIVVGVHPVVVRLLTVEHVEVVEQVRCRLGDPRARSPHHPDQVGLEIRQQERGAVHPVSEGGHAR